MERHEPANILIVDDHRENLLAMLAVLDGLGLNLVTARSGPEALRAVLSQDFAVILLDVQMADMDGFETARLIKQREKSRYTPIIFVTAINWAEQHVFKGYDVGAVDYLFKPVVPEILKAKVTVFVDLFNKNVENELQAAQLRQAHAELEAKLESERALQASLEKITDLYRISNSVGSVRTVQDVLEALLDSHYLKISGARVLLFNRPWEQYPPSHYEIFAASSKSKVNRNGRKRTLPLESYPFVRLLSGAESVVINPLDASLALSPDTRASLNNANVTRVMLIPLCNAASWYGLLELRFKGDEPWSADDVRHIERLVDQVLMAIDNLMLLKFEAEARAQAERANQLKLQFLGMISHELRTPLASIKGFSTTLLADDITWDHDTERSFLAIINEEADKLTNLIEQLLDVSRLQAGTLSITPELRDFSEVLDEAALHLDVLTREHRLSVQLAPELPALRVDSQRIAQVLENLVGNAVKYSAPNTEVRISVSSDPDGIRVDVTDRGYGIPAEEQANIFDAFHQIKRTRNVPGAGLGLAICKGLVEAHGGRIWVEDTSPAGTTISFSLPAASVPQGDDASLEPLH